MKDNDLVEYVKKLNCVKWTGMQNIIDFCNLTNSDKCGKILQNCTIKNL